MNNVKAFWDYACEYKLGNEIPKRDVHKHYLDFCEIFNLVSKEERQFGKDLKFYAPNLGSRRPRIEGKQVAHWVNIELSVLSELRDTFPSMYSTFLVHQDRSTSLTQLTQLTQIEKVKQLIDKMLEEAEDEPISIKEVIIEVVKTGIDKKVAVMIIDRLKRDGELFEPQPERISKP